MLWAIVQKGRWRTAGLSLQGSPLPAQSVHSLMPSGNWSRQCWQFLQFLPVTVLHLTGGEGDSSWARSGKRPIPAENSVLSPSWKQVWSCLTSLQPWRWNFNWSDWWKRGGKVWFGCRTPSRDLLHSTPCPDGTSSRALGITPCHAGSAVVPQGWEHGKGLQSALMLKHKILDPR